MIRLQKNKKQMVPLKALIYGKPGVGKTQLAATAIDAPTLKEVLFVNVEGGLLTIQDKDFIIADIGKDSNGVLTKSSVEDLSEIVFKILTKQPGYVDIKTIVLDSATELQARNIEDVWDRDKSPGIPGIKDYGKDSYIMKKLFRQLRDSPLNIIITALEKEQTEGELGKPQTLIDIRPALTDSVGEMLMSYVDFVWRMYEKDGVRKLLTVPKGKYRAKTRNANFLKEIGEIIENPNLSEIHAKLIKVTNE